ncbi:hypothetical protein F4821DRAFT_233618 [Hypoxylon rubiginosum]|uniref:Uncharacterized protein n=1 Tax=Hypoxylon rubiginosum TaxID=110542 RepID=A0ACC0D6K6_9PEZI|nr:hypothetical protein F4821DRAFT_233618 [Hypoxylon rubiginosum]
MQGDIFQMEQMAVQVCARVQPISLPLDDNAHAEVAIYNEDDLSHLLYHNHIHDEGHKHKVIVNHVYRDGFTTPPESASTGTQTPVSEGDETPMLSDCESDFDEGVSPTSSLHSHSRRNPLKFEDGFDFPVFLGRQADDSVPQEMAQPSLQEPVSELSQAKHVRIAAADNGHVSDISGPMMSWWPGPMELMEHEWAEQETVEATPKPEHVSSIEGPLMSWWPASVNIMEHDWNERFYE